MEPDKMEIEGSVTSALAAMVSDKFMQAKSLRVLQETIWKVALQNYNGEYGTDVTFREGASSVFVNITQMKTMAAYSRLISILLPSSGFPWSIQPTPHPDLVKIGLTTKAALNSPEISPEMKEQLALARSACDGMRNKIKDDLIETRWEEKLQRGLLDLVTFGTMVFKGPLAAPPRPKRWILSEPSLAQKAMGAIGIKPKLKYRLVADPNDKNRPDMEWVSPFEFYPDPAAYSIEEAMWAIHRHVMNKQQISEMAINDNFDADEINAVLNEIPDGNWSAEPWESGVDIINRRSGSLPMGKRYIVMEFWGFLSGKELRQAGQDIPDEDLNKMHLSNVWVCGNHCIKVSVSNRESGKLPFFVTPYEQVPYKMWGRGIPEKMADPQAIINATSRAMVENMGICAGPQVVVDVNRMVDGFKWEQVIPWGIWPVKNMEGATNPPVQFVTIPSMLSELKVLQDIFRNFTQEVTSLPDMSSGIMGNQQHNRTAGGMAMIFGATDTYTRSVISNVDSRLTKGMIREHYNWEMQYCPDQSIKGDMQVDASGVQGLMAREQTAVKISEMMQAIGQIPGGADWLNMSELMKEILRSMDMISDALVYTEEEVNKQRAVKAQQEQQQQAAIAQAQNLPKPKAETTPQDAIMQVLEKTQPTDPIYPIMYAKLLDHINELDPQSVAALNMMKTKVVAENRAFADQQELAVMQQDIEMESKIRASMGQDEPEPTPPNGGTNAGNPQAPVASQPA